MPKRIKLGKCEKCAIVDNEDYQYLVQWKWYARKNRTTWYAIRSMYLGGGKQNRKIILIYMHRLIMGLKHGDKRVIDHIDRNGLNNQKRNLSVCSNGANIQRQITNRQNKSSPYRGVRKLPGYNRWVAQSHHVYLGCFSTEKEAARAYDSWALNKYGPLAFINGV